ncbi:hypothetical protein JW877_00270 [bacterium]|nr:hypothetical protein [bacterium]
MKFKFLLFLFIGILITTLTGQETTETIAVFGFKTINIDPSIGLTAHELFKNELVISGAFSVFDTDYSEIQDCYSLDCVVQNCRNFKVNKCIYGSLTALGNKIIVAVNMVDANLETIIFSDQLTASQIEDLDMVIKRLTSALISRKPAGEVITKETVTLVETEEPRRRKNFYTFGLRIGYLFPFGSSYGGESELTSYDFVGLYEMEHFIVEAHFAIRSGDDADEQAIDFSLLYTPLLGDFSPYLAAGLGVHWVDINNYEEEYFYYSDGPSLNLGGGLFAFQTYDFRFVIDLRYSYVFLLDEEADNQHGLTLTLGITHRKESGGGFCFGLF